MVWLNLSGLFIDIVGAAFLYFGAFPGISIDSSNQGDFGMQRLHISKDGKKILNLEAQLQRVKRSKIGAFLLILGFLLQAISQIISIQGISYFG